MFEVSVHETGEIILSGRFDAIQVEKAKSVFDTIQATTKVNFRDLEYISSAGLGVLLATQKRLNHAGHGLQLINLNKYVLNVFQYAGFDNIFKIEKSI